jgi:hypothetical protein
VAEVLPHDAAGPEALSHAIGEVLASASHRSASLALRDDMSTMASVEDLVDRLEAIVSLR